MLSFNIQSVILSLNILMFKILSVMLSFNILSVILSFNILSVILSFNIQYSEHHSEFRYAECRYTGYRSAVEKTLFSGLVSIKKFKWTFSSISGRDGFKSPITEWAPTLKPLTLVIYAQKVRNLIKNSYDKKWRSTLIEFSFTIEGSTGKG